MKRHVRLLGIVAVALMASNGAATSDPVSPEFTLPEPLAQLSGKVWLLSDARPFQYVQYEAAADNGILTFGGMDNDGNVIGGYFAIDPSTGETTLFSVRNGGVAHYDVLVDDQSIIMTGEDSGANVRQTYRRLGFAQFKVAFEERRNGRWIAIREADYHLATPEAVRALNWIERNPEAERAAELARVALMDEQPSFFRRFVFAIQDGLVVGVQTGVETGVSDRIHEEITNEDVGAVE